MQRLTALLALLLAVPVLGLATSWLRLDTASLQTLAHQAQTVLPGYVGQSLLLAAGVGVGVVLVGTGAAALVALFEFRGRRSFEWALMLPMAMPAYVLAYAATDFLQFSGPAQTTLRAAFGWQGALWPDVRSLGGAIVLFVFCLYPYVYLLARAALAEQALRPMEAARLLGASPWRRVREVALPMARPAIAAGVALALMETLADYGVGAYFGLATFTTGIYRAWLSMNDTAAAAQLATLLLVVVAALVALERRARRRMRFSQTRQAAAVTTAAAPRIVLRGAAGWLAAGACALPIAVGFVGPVAVLIGLWAGQGGSGLDAAAGVFDSDRGPPLQGASGGDGAAAAGWARWGFDPRFATWAGTSLTLAAVSALLAVGLALLLAAAERLARSAAERRLAGASSALVSLGYAVPGAVIAVGILLPLGWVQAGFPQLGASGWVVGTAAGLVYAYLVRFGSVALQAVRAGYEQIPPALDETARLMGHGRTAVAWRVHAPLLRRSAAVAGLLVFVDVMKELPATLVLRPFDSDTLAIVAYQFARDERLAEAALPSLAIVAVGLLPVILLARTLGGSSAPAAVSPSGLVPPSGIEPKSDA